MTWGKIHALTSCLLEAYSANHHSGSDEVADNERNRYKDKLTSHLTLKLSTKASKQNRTSANNIGTDRKHTVTFNKTQECFWQGDKIKGFKHFIVFNNCRLDGGLLPNPSSDLNRALLMLCVVKIVISSPSPSPSSPSRFLPFFFFLLQFYYDITDI